MAGDGAPVMAYETWSVRIRDNASGEVATYLDEFGDPSGETYIWEEGNYGCDCNRALFFARAKGRDDPDIACGDVRFTILSIARPDGSVIYAE